jgi:chitin synthase
MRDSFPRMYQSDHSIIRLFFLHLQVVYNTINLLMSWFQLGNWFLSFSIIITLVAESLRNPPAGVDGDCWKGSPFEAGDVGFFHKYDFLGELK